MLAEAILKYHQQPFFFYRTILIPELSESSPRPGREGVPGAGDVVDDPSVAFSEEFVCGLEVCGFPFRGIPDPIEDTI